MCGFRQAWFLDQMAFRFNLRFNRRTITFGGIGGLILLVGIFSIPSFFAASLTPERAQKEIRQYLKVQLSSRFMREMQTTGLSSPDFQMATRLQAGYEQIDQLKFVSIEVDRFVFVPPFTSHRLFIVKAVTRDVDQQEQTRYFSFSTRNKFFDFFWVTEQSRLMWMLSI